MANTADYGYDATDQLTSANHSAQTDEAYSFDENGNRTMAGYVTTANNRLQSDGVYTYVYDNEGNLTRRTEIATGSYVDYTWDHRNRLILAEFKTAGHAVIKAVRFRYDVFDRRIAREEDNSLPFLFTDAAIERYVHDGEHVAMVFDGTGALTHRVLHNPEVIDQVLADEQFDATVPGAMPTHAGEVYWPLQDHQNTVRQMVDSSGAVVFSATFGSFGQVLNINNPTDVAYLFIYTGREYDPDLNVSVGRLNAASGGQN